MRGRVRVRVRVGVRVRVRARFRVRLHARATRSSHCAIRAASRACVGECPLSESACVSLPVSARACACIRVRVCSAECGASECACACAAVVWRAARLRVVRDRGAPEAPLRVVVRGGGVLELGRGRGRRGLGRGERHARRRAAVEDALHVCRVSVSARAFRGEGTPRTACLQRAVTC